jgi:hydrogenase nickel incorporation protein HypA/HybF
MHELSIAASILDIAEARAREQKSSSIQVIGIRLGEFTNIAREALEFAFEAARQGTLAHNARLEIEVVPMIVECVVCHGVNHPERTLCLICAHCGFPLKIVSGEELQVDYIELETEAERLAWKEYQYKQMC